MIMRKVLSLFVFLGLFVFLVGCNSTIESAINKLEGEGYVLEKVSDEETSRYIGDTEGVEAIYEIFLEGNTTDVQGRLYVFDSEEDLDNLLEDEQEPQESIDEHRYKNIWVVDYTKAQELMDIIKG